MRVFVIGGTGLAGSALIPELQGAGHTVVGPARSPQSEQSLRRMGAT